MALLGRVLFITENICACYLFADITSLQNS